MVYQNLKLEREKLYKQVWSKPMIHLAKEYGLSDTGLRKICRRYNIPLPDSGYWQKIQYGKPVNQPPLPESNGNSSILITKLKKEIPPVEPKFYNEIQAKITQELLPENKIIVSNTLTKPHSLVMQAKKNIRIPFEHKDCVVSEWGFIDIFVNRTNMNRALCIMDTLIKALEARGILIFINSKERKPPTCVDILGEVFEIDLHETLKRTEAKDGYLSRSDFKPSGELVLRIKKEFADYRTRWSDGKNQRVEDHLNSFIVGLYEAALWERGERLEIDKRHREWEKEERRQEEARRLKEEELKRVKGLENEALNWHKSQDIRSYIQAAEKAYLQKDGSIQPGSEFEKWRAWAIQQADRLDPLINKLPSVSDEEGEGLD